MALRLSRGKSHHGCLVCKRRRVKCDEKQPICSSCIKRGDPCEYGTLNSWKLMDADSFAQSPPRPSVSKTFSSKEPTQNVPDTEEPPVDPIALAITSSFSHLPPEDLELMIQWGTSTYVSMSRNRHTEHVWRDVVPKEALCYPFLMHGILGLSALHLSRAQSDLSRKNAYFHRAVQHQDYALSLYRARLNSINEGNITAYFAFAGVVAVYAFGIRLNQGEHDSLRCMDALYQVLVLIRGVQGMLESVTEFRYLLLNSPFAPIFQIEEAQGPFPESVKAAFERLYEANTVSRERDQYHEEEIYHQAIQELEVTFSWAHGGMRRTTIAGRWPIRLSSRFMDQLRDRKPFAFVIIAHYGVLLRHLSHIWFYDDWCIRIVRSVWDALDNQWRPFVRWPLRETMGYSTQDHAGVDETE